MNIVSLFSGGGGLDLGFKKAGFNILWANEFDKKIEPTHKFNFKETILNTNSIKEVNESDIPDCVGIIGGPPCQSFSEAGKKLGTLDNRGLLFLDYIRIVKAKKPKFFVAENVSGMLTKRHENDLNFFISEFKNCGYNVSYNLYNSSDYGVAQDRERLFFVGYREDCNFEFKVPLVLNNKICLKDVLDDLPSPVSTKNGRTNLNQTINAHEYMLGGFSSMFMSRNRVRSWEERSFTILATARQIPLHPQAPKMIKVEKDKFIFKPGYENLYRRLSVRECARIQGFPDDHFFIYDKVEDGYKMVGNAVPVNLAKIIAEKIKKDLSLFN